MDVFILAGEERPVRELALDRVQAGEQLVAIVRGDDLPRGKHPCVRARLRDVLGHRRRSKPSELFIRWKSGCCDRESATRASSLCREDRGYHGPALFACWIAFPLLLAVLAYGGGAMVERASARKLPLTLLLPCGLALTIAVLDLFTRWTSTVSFAIPAVSALAVGGLVLRPPWRRPRLEWAFLPALIVFAVYSAPIVLSGTATWAGYVKLDDTATWLALVDRTLSSGHTLAGLAPSTYMDTLAAYLTNGYPVGAFLPLGLGHAFLGEDIAWLTDPWMAFLAAMCLAVALPDCFACLGRECTSPANLGDRGPCGPAGPSLRLLPVGWDEGDGGRNARGGLRKRHIASVGVCGAGLHTQPRARDDPRAGGHMGAAGRAQCGWAGLGSTGRRACVAGAHAWPWYAVAFGAHRAWRDGCVRLGGLLGSCAWGGFLEQNRSVLTGGNELGNLLAPLRLRQIVGIWPSGDFRVTPSQLTITNLLIGLGALLGSGRSPLCDQALTARSRGLRVVLALGRIARVLDRLALVGGEGVSASASPAIVFAALLACAVLLARRHRWQRAVGLLAGLALATGIVWSNVLGYHEVSLAPRAQFAELAQIGEEIAGDGPTLMTDFSPFGARHFRREAEPESASELRSRVDPLRSGQPLAKSITSGHRPVPAGPVARLPHARAPPLAGCEPPSLPVCSGLAPERYWEVWQRRTPASPPVLAHLPLGNVVQPGGVPTCASIHRLTRLQGVRALEAVPVENPIVVAVGEGSHPRGWSEIGEHLDLAGAGTARIPVSVARQGRYEIWLGGSIGGSVSIAVERHARG